MPTDDEINIGEVGMQEEDEDKSLADKLRGVRTKLQRKEKATRAKRRAKARRIEREEPETLGEEFAVKQSRLEEATTEAKKAVGDARDLVETKFGAADKDGDSLIGELSDGLSTAAEGLNSDGLAEPVDLGDEDPMMSPVEGPETEAVSSDDEEVVEAIAMDPTEEPVDDDLDDLL
jgi:hypothetical protein